MDFDFGKYIKIAQLKSQAKKTYLLWQREVEEFSCGISVAEYMKPSIGRLRKKFNNIMEQLSKLDPEAPKVRI